MVFKIIIVTMLLCVVVLSGCDGGGSKDPQRLIRITGIPAVHNGRYGQVALGDAGKVLAANPAIFISSGEITVSLFEANGETIDTSKPFTKSGNYIVVFVVTDSSLKTTYWAGRINNANISNDLTTFTFNDFTNVPLTNISTSLNMMKTITEVLKTQSSE